MADAFWSSDEFDERAHQLYNEGRYDEAVDILRQGLHLYPDCIELHIGMGYARLAREEFAWARRAFAAALNIEPDHEDALAGLGEVLLKLGQPEQGAACFERVLALGFTEDLEIVLQMGRALFREGLIENARRFFSIAREAHPDNAEATACLGYAWHRLSREKESVKWLRRAIALDASHSEARIYLANLLYDRGDYEDGLAEFDRTDPQDHWDELGIWRVIELKKSIYRLTDDDPELKPWLVRLADLAGEADPTELLLAEIEAAGPDGSGGRDPAQLELFGTLLTELQAMQKRPGTGEPHAVASLSGRIFRGSWEEILLQMKAADREWSDAPLTEFMRDLARRGAAETGVVIPMTDAEAFIRGSAEAGVLRILH